jgi:hypothetical protein
MAEIYDKVKSPDTNGPNRRIQNRALSMYQNQKSRFPDLREMLSHGDEPLLMPLTALCDEVESAVLDECRSKVTSSIERAYGIIFEKISSLTNVIAATYLGTRLHLKEDVQASREGYILSFELSMWPNESAEDLVTVFAVDVNGVGRIVQILFLIDRKLPNIAPDKKIISELRAVVESWYSLLESYSERVLRRLTSDVIERLLIEVRSVVPRPHNDAVWLYAIVGDYGFSLTDLAARRRVISSVLNQRGHLEASPIEAAISLIAVEEKRALSFSDEVLRRGTLTDISLPKTQYERLVQDTERSVYGSDTISAKLIAVTPNREIGIVAAFPKGEGVDHIIATSLERHNETFQQLLDRFGNELRLLIGTVERVTKGATKTSASTNKSHTEPGYFRGRIFRLTPAS